MGSFTLILVDVETKRENWIFLKYGRETPCAIPIYKVLPYLVIHPYRETV